MLFLDSTNVLPNEFCSIAREHFNNELVCAASGVIDNHESAYGVSAKWRSRHLFKAEMNYNSFHLTNSLTTYGTLLRKDAVLVAGNFNPSLKHSEDTELGFRLLAKGFKIIGDPNLIVQSFKSDTILSVLERYWRWYGGSNEKMSWLDYTHAIKASFRPMIENDLKAYDLGSAMISLLCPHYGFIRHNFRKVFNKLQKTK